VTANVGSHLTVTVGLNPGPLDGRHVPMRRSSRSSSVPSSGYRSSDERLFLSSSYRSFGVENHLAAHRRGGPLLYRGAPHDRSPS
jgi:hypothetical protein